MLFTLSKPSKILISDICGHLRLAWSIIWSCDPFVGGSNNAEAIAPGGADGKARLAWLARTLSKNVLPDWYSFLTEAFMPSLWLMGGGGKLNKPKFGGGSEMLGGWGLGDIGALLKSDIGSCDPERKDSKGEWVAESASSPKLEVRVWGRPELVLVWFGYGPNCADAHPDPTYEKLLIVGIEHFIWAVHNIKMCGWWGAKREDKGLFVGTRVLNITEQVLEMLKRWMRVAKFVRTFRKISIDVVLYYLDVFLNISNRFV